jgi:hypothetical protein
MTRDDKPEAAVSEKRNEYAYWAIPGSAASVTYSLPLFHEIDFAVNEGYRKISHGGVEEGGLLFGNIDGKGTRIEAFRLIACEHASGPSFSLSERDLEALSEQLAGAATDSDLEGLEPVGWFLAHTRSSLLLTDREVELFDHYFAKPGMLTVLIKPERFQPTRFGFLVRGRDGSMPRDANDSAVILPLAGRSARNSNEAVASIPAPALNAGTARREMEVELPEEYLENEGAGRSSAVANLPPAPPVIADDEPGSPAPRRHRRLTLDHVRPKEGEEDIPPVTAAQTASGQELEPMRLGAMAAHASETALAPHSREDQDADSLSDPYKQIALLNKKKAPSRAARLVMVLPLAALLGCMVGYVAYLQVPSPIIPLTVKSKGQTVIVTWPAEETRSAVYAVVRVDDSTPVMLTAEERIAGRVEVTTSADMKVELIARNWIHDSRGIVRFVKPNANTAP